MRRMENYSFELICGTTSKKLTAWKLKAILRTGVRTKRCLNVQCSDCQENEKVKRMAA